jgi:hypothetical protein
LADQHRRIRFAQRLKQLIPVAVEQKNISGAISLARLIMVLEGWLPSNSRDAQPDPQSPAPDMSKLIEQLEQDK